MKLTGDRLARLHAARRLVPFAGTGVSFAATDENPHASWVGLLKDGIERCVQVVPALRRDWRETTRARLNQGDIVTYLNVADEVSLRLKALSDGREFDAWIRETVGALTCKRPELLDAVGALGPLIVTTNYDTLLDDRSKRPSITYTDDDFAPALTGQNEAVLHLHGVAREPASVVLGSTDYERLLQGGKAFLKESLFAMHQFVFIGCGDGLRDPSIAPVLNLLDTALPTKVEHFLLVRGIELRRAIEQPISNSVIPIAFGRRFDELALFLHDLATDRALTPSQDFSEYEGRADSSRPRTAVLDLAAPAEQALQEARDALGDILRAMASVERRGKAPDGIGEWDSLRDRQAVHEQLAAALAQPLDRLVSASPMLVQALAEADGHAGQLLAKRFTEDRSRLTPLIELTTELDELCTHLLARVDDFAEDLSARLRDSTDYVPRRAQLRDAAKMLGEASKLATALHAGFHQAEGVQTSS